MGSRERAAWLRQGQQPSSQSQKLAMEEVALYPKLPEKIFCVFGMEEFFSPVRFLDGFPGQGIGGIDGGIDAAGQAFFPGHPCDRHVAKIGGGQPHCRKHSICFSLCSPINPEDDNKVSLWHGSSPCAPCSHIVAPQHGGSNGLALLPSLRRGIAPPLRHKTGPLRDSKRAPFCKRTERSPRDWPATRHGMPWL